MGSQVIPHNLRRLEVITPTQARLFPSNPGYFALQAKNEWTSRENYLCNERTSLHKSRRQDLYQSLGRLKMQKLWGTVIAQQLSALFLNPMFGYLHEETQSNIGSVSLQDETLQSSNQLIILFE